MCRIRVISFVKWFFIIEIFERKFVIMSLHILCILFIYCSISKASLLTDFNTQYILLWFIIVDGFSPLCILAKLHMSLGFLSLSRTFVMHIQHMRLLWLIKCNKSFAFGVEKPRKVAEFRPISLCNVIYRIVAKTITNRLKQVLHNIISPTQIAFIPETHIW